LYYLLQPFVMYTHPYVCLAESLNHAEHLAARTSKTAYQFSAKEI
jgi:hypothetical protein